MRLSIVIPTLARAPILERALDRLDRQTGRDPDFEVIVVADANEPDPDAVAATIEGRPYPARLLRADEPGVSAARNRGWRAAAAPLVLFFGDDMLPDRHLVAEHLAWHERHADERVAVLGHVRWARELGVTPFMRWLDHGVQFDYPRIRGIEAGWGRFYAANVSLKRSLIERAGGFDESYRFGYEELELAYRLNELGMRLVYDRRAIVEHLHPPTVDDWRRRMATVARAERRFVAEHPDVEPYFLDLFRRAESAPRARGRGARLAHLVPRRTPWLGPRVWSSVDASFLQALAPAFLAAWERAEAEAAQPAVRPASSGGSSPGGPK
jgi:GT2 family glycosyltransferase